MAREPSDFKVLRSMFRKKPAPKADSGYSVQHNDASSSVESLETLRPDDSASNAGRDYYDMPRASAPKASRKPVPRAVEYPREQRAIEYPRESRDSGYSRQPRDSGYSRQPRAIDYPRESRAIEYPRESRAVAYPQESRAVAYPRESRDSGSRRINAPFFPPPFEDAYSRRGGNAASSVQRPGGYASPAIRAPNDNSYRYLSYEEFFVDSHGSGSNRLQLFDTGPTGVGIPDMLNVMGGLLGGGGPFGRH